MRYTAIKITPLGEHDVKYGTRYWGTVKEADLPVSFNMMNPVNISEGAVVEYEERTTRESKKGTEYLQLKKVKVLGSAVKTEEEKTSTTSIAGYLRLIYTEQRKHTVLLEKLAGEDKATTLTDEELEKDVTLDDLGGEQVDLSEIPF